MFICLYVCHLKWQSTWIEFSTGKSLILFEAGNSINKRGVALPDKSMFYISGLTLESELNRGHTQ